MAGDNIEDRAEEIVIEIDGMIENLKETKVRGQKEDYCFEYRAELEVEIIEKAMLIINYIKAKGDD